jgi:hypothetical protein
MYNVKNLVDNNYDFSVVFNEKQDSIRKSTGLDFNLSEIVSFLQKQTNNFTIESPIAKDLDEAIFKVVKKFAEEKGQKLDGETPPIPMPEETPQTPEDMREEGRQNIYFAVDSFVEGDEETAEFIKFETEFGGYFDSEDDAKKWYDENGFDYIKFNS